MTNQTINYPHIFKTLRSLYNLTQKDLADKIGVTKSTISNYENSYSVPPMSVIMKISDALDILPLNILSLDENLSNKDKLKTPRATQSANDVYIPFYSHDTLKNPDFLNFKNYMDYYITLPGFMLDKCDDYICIKAPDSSMSEDNIHKNDFVFVKRTLDVPNKSIVLAINKTNGKIILRRIFNDENIVSFIPSSRELDFSIIRFEKDQSEYEIIGYVKNVLSSVKEF